MNQEEYKLAQTDFDKAIVINPKSVIAYTYRGENFYKLGRLEEALQDMNMAVDLLINTTAPEFESTEMKTLWKLSPLLNRAMVHDKMGRPDLAAKDREFAKLLVPNLQIIE